MSKVTEYIYSLPEYKRACLSSYQIEKRGDHYAAWVGRERVGDGVSMKSLFTALEYAQDAVIEAYKREVQAMFPNIVESWKPNAPP